MGEFDEIVKHSGVVMAGRFGPNWKVADQKLTSLFIETPAAAQVMTSFAAAIQGLLNAVSLAVENVSPETWVPLRGWTFSSGDFIFAMHGDRFLVAQAAKVQSIDELRGLLAQTSTP